MTPYELNMLATKEIEEHHCRRRKPRAKNLAKDWLAEHDTTLSVKTQQIKGMLAEGNTVTDIAAVVLCSRSSVYKVKGGGKLQARKYTRDGDIHLRSHAGLAGNTAARRTPEDILIDKGLSNIVAALPTKDRDIVQARVDGLSDEQIMCECHTGRPHIHKVFQGLREKAKEYLE